MPRKLSVGSDSDEESTAVKAPTATNARIRVESDDSDREDAKESKIPAWKRKKELQAAQKQVSAKKVESDIREDGNAAEPSPSADAGQESLAPAPGLNAGGDATAQASGRIDGAEAEFVSINLPPVSSFRRYADPHVIPWVPLNTRRKEEAKMFFRVDNGRDGIARTARASMKMQGLYVTKDSSILSWNIERATQRSKVRAISDQLKREAQIISSPSSCSQLMDTLFWTASLPSATSLLKGLMHVSFEGKEQIFISPFEPIQDPVCRPSTKYDPSLPYMQYR